MTLRQQEVVETDVLTVEEAERLDAEVAGVLKAHEADGLVVAAPDVRKVDDEPAEPEAPQADVPKVEVADTSTSEGTDDLRVKGAMLVRVRGMTPEERAAEGWQDHPEDIACVEYDNGAVLYSACERCDEPGTIYASYAGGRWGIDSAGEPYQRPTTRKVIPKWVYPAVALAVLVAGLAAVGVAMLWTVNEDQRSQVDEQQQIIREQRSLMDRQADTQRTVQRILRSNQAELEKSLRDVKRQVAGVAADRNGLRDANAQLRESNARLKQRVERLGQD